MDNRSSSTSSGSSEVSIDSPEAWPKLVAFDLDHTLWDAGIDDDISGPVKPHEDKCHIVGSQGRHVLLFPDVPAILAQLRAKKIHIAVTSKAIDEDLAKNALENMQWEYKGEKHKAATFFDSMEIHNDTKFIHFRKTKEKTDIPYEQMLFFDDETPNYEVEDLGLTMQLVPQSGFDMGVFEEGVKLWRKKNGITVVN